MRSSVFLAISTLSLIVIITTVSDGKKIKKKEVKDVKIEDKNEAKISVPTATVDAQKDAVEVKLADLEKANRKSDERERRKQMDAMDQLRLSVEQLRFQIASHEALRQTKSAEQSKQTNVEQNRCQYMRATSGGPCACKEGERNIKEEQNQQRQQQYEEDILPGSKSQKQQKLVPQAQLEYVQCKQECRKRRDEMTAEQYVERLRQELQQAEDTLQKHKELQQEEEEQQQEQGGGANKIDNDDVILMEPVNG